MAEIITMTEDPELIKWKKDQVKSRMKKFQSVVDGKKGNLQAQMMEATFPEGETSLSSYEMKFSVSANDPADNLFKYSAERSRLTAFIDAKGRKFGAIPQTPWQLFKGNEHQLSLDHYMKKYQFTLAITRTDRFLYSFTKGNIGQAVLGFLRNK